MSFQFSPKSLEYIAGVPTLLSFESSADKGWTSLLTTNVQARNREPYERPQTKDQIIVINAGQPARLSFYNGHWQRRWHPTGGVATFASSEMFRLGIQALPGSDLLKAIHVFIPHSTIIEAAEHFRKPGGSMPSPPASAMAVEDRTVAQVGHALVSAMRVGAPDIYAQAAAQWLAVHLLARGAGPWDSEDRRRPGTFTNFRLSRALTYIEENLGAPIDLDAIALEAGVSKFHFTRLFREKFEVTPMRYLFSKRLEKAAQMLGSTDLTVKQVALHCGFTSVDHFSGKFLRKFGETPTSYRKGGRR